MIWNTNISKKKIVSLFVVNFKLDKLNFILLIYHLLTITKIELNKNKFHLSMYKYVKYVSKIYS